MKFILFTGKKLSALVRGGNFPDWIKNQFGKVSYSVAEKICC